jgi:hypothetical protein
MQRAAIEHDISELAPEPARVEGDEQPEAD